MIKYRFQTCIKYSGDFLMYMNINGYILCSRKCWISLHRHLILPPSLALNNFKQTLEIEVALRKGHIPPKKRLTFQHHKKFIQMVIRPRQGPRGSLLGTNRHYMALINSSGKNMCVCVCVSEVAA